ncbi:MULTISPECIES: hypothetical protein [Variovorax]|uniref:Transmembrane protein n=1 Tax=Variovorax ginsengisoli TaxID=363844 RepID=A0ABT8S368_9BURK|nr:MULTISPECIES: hypothetical protein [Variovorax]MDM0082491.1 hypothetical protein [Variovorax sp. J31P179]MDN8613247.1 hypothetical protein [Variovorax ginsengisoli]MDO1532417.1 hypothetical protein [Variovorax ginsengisoli]
MNDTPTPPEPFATPRPEPRARTPLPAGYREGIITAITVIIGFSLSFVRYWAFEAPGDWTARSVVALVALLIPIAAEIYTLYRALLVEDDDEATYRTTVKWFIGSVCGMLVSVSLAAIVLSGRP